MGYLNNSGLTRVWNKIKAKIGNTDISGVGSTVTAAVSNLSQQIDNVRALTGPYKFRIDSNPSSATYNHLLMDYEDGYSPSNWSVPSSGQYEGHLIYTFTY